MLRVVRHDGLVIVGVEVTYVHVLRQPELLLH